MRFTSSNVGIGTTSPARPLDVNGSARLSDGASLEWGGTSANIAGSSSSDTLFFRTASTERARIDSSGNLSIGNTSAGAKLDIRQDSGYAIRAENASGHYFRVAAGGTIEVGGSAFVSASRAITAASITTTGASTIDELTVSNDTTLQGGLDVTDNVTIGGNLTVSGTTTTIDTTNLDVKDKNITLNYGSGDTSSNANGAGITIQDALIQQQMRLSCGMQLMMSLISHMVLHYQMLSY